MVAWRACLARSMLVVWPELASDHIFVLGKKTGFRANFRKQISRDWYRQTHRFKTFSRYMGLYTSLQVQNRLEAPKVLAAAITSDFTAETTLADHLLPRQPVWSTIFSNCCLDRRVVQLCRPTCMPGLPLASFWKAHIAVPYEVFKVVGRAAGATCMWQPAAGPWPRLGAHGPDAPARAARGGWRALPQMVVALRLLLPPHGASRQRGCQALV